MEKTKKKLKNRYEIDLKKKKPLIPSKISFTISLEYAFFLNESLEEENIKFLD